MKTQLLLLIVLPLVIVVKAETIHFTNSPSHLVRSKNFTTYKLEVPGSNTITIVEANDEDRTSTYSEKSNEQSSSDSREEEESTEFKPSNSSMVRNPSEFFNDTPSTESKKTVFAPTLLEKFMQEYKSKVRSELSVDSEQSEESREGPGYRRDRYRDYEKFDDEAYHRTKMRNPFNDKEGWVSLQAVPWSKSQVAKWKPKGDVKPLESVSSINVYRKPHPFKQDIPSKWDNSDEIKVPHYSHNRPAVYEYDEREQHGSGHNTFEGPSSTYIDVPWNTNKPSKWTNQKHEIEAGSNSDRWYDYGFRPDFDDQKKPVEDEILISDYNSNIVRVPIKRKHQQQQSLHPQPSHNYNRSPYSRHPSSHPSNGNGDWVLLSTTKGYHSNRIHRAMNMSESQPSTGNIKMHKAIKLTVLPAKSDGTNKTPMTTSHGGLIEVSSSLQPVEASVAEATNKNKNKSNKSKDNPKKPKYLQAVALDNRADDQSAVLAAVGAGMVPATVAMLMPMVLGRKRRAIFHPERWIDENH